MRESSPRRERAANDEAAEPSGRELVQRYGRDPRRPTWADAGRERATGAETIAAEQGDRRRQRRHTSTCAACGQAAETTFRPDPSRPVYCDGCYRNRRDTRREAVAGS